MRKWICTTLIDIEKPFTDSEYGCEYYHPSLIVFAATRGQAKALFASEFEDVHFCNVSARVYHGNDKPQLPYEVRNISDEEVHFLLDLLKRG